MGKYFKEDSNQRLSQVSNNIDVDFLAKKLIVSQTQLFNRAVGPKGLGTTTRTLQPSKKGLKYAKPPVGSSILDILGSLGGPKIRYLMEAIKAFSADKSLSARFDGDLINNTLNTWYQLTPTGKTTTRPVQLRDILNNYDIDSKTLKIPYDFTEKQLDDIHQRILTLEKQSDKWFKWKAGVGLGLPTAVGGGFVGKAAIEHALDPSTPSVKSTVQTIVDKQPQNATNPRAGQR